MVRGVPGAGGARSDGPRSLRDGEEVPRRLAESPNAHEAAQERGDVPEYTLRHQVSVEDEPVFPSAREELRRRVEAQQRAARDALAQMVAADAWVRALLAEAERLEIEDPPPAAGGEAGGAAPSATAREAGRVSAPVRGTASGVAVEAEPFGMNTKAKGSRAEHRCMRLLEAAGYVGDARQRQSRTVRRRRDRSAEGVRRIQVKSGTGRLSSL